MFDTSRDFEIDLYGEKTCVVRWPTDEEWAARARANKTVRRILSGGRTKSETPDQESTSSDLLAKIRKDDGVPFEPEEATLLIAKMLRAEVEDSTRDEGGYTITLRVFGGVTTTHKLKKPSIKEMFRTQGAMSDPMQTRREIIVRYPLEPGAKLYDSLILSAEGYAGAVPIIHKDAVATEIINMMAEIRSPGESPE